MSRGPARKVIDMQHVPTIEAARRAFRATICPVCHVRPPGSETLPPTTPRACEPTCAIFLHVEQLKQIAKTSAGDRPGSYELAILNQVCNRCCVQPTAGDYCQHRASRTCPLSCFSGEAVAILEGLVTAERTAKRRAEQAQKHGAEA
jgi:hypothetical protein